MANVQTTQTSIPADPVKPIVPIKIKRGDRRADFISALSYGRSRSGKTRFLATWPRPLILAEASERGWKTIETMPVESFYEPDVDAKGEPLHAPIIWPIEDAAQMAMALQKVPEMIASGEVLTLGVDSLTFYQDSFFAFLKKKWAQNNPGKPIDTRSLYGTLADHLGDIRQRIHAWHCNVVWLALEKAPDADTPSGGPLLTGKARERFPAGCDHVWYHETYTLPNPDNNNEQERFYEMHTTSYMKWLAGGRDSGLLEPSIFNPTYRIIAEQLGLGDPLAHLTPAQRAKRSS